MSSPHRALLIALLLVAALVLTSAGAAVSFSELWGADGRNWDPQGRLPDFSYAGYHCGERPLPSLEGWATVNVRDFGARGDGDHDDSDAFLQALEAGRGGVVEVPAGRYKITKILEIRHANTVLKGAGRDQTTLDFPVPLNDIRPNWGETTSGRRTSNYSWSGGFVWFRGDTGGEKLADITGNAERGGKSLRVSDTGSLRTGQRVEIHQRDDADNSLADHLYSGDAGDTAKLNGRTTASLVVTILAIDGDTIRFDRPLRFDVRSRWRPEIRRFAPTVTETGVEGLTFEFPNTPYQGHFTELGNNAVAMTGVTDCWARDLRIVNPDSGLFISGRFNTVTGVVIESERAPDPDRRSRGHHGVYLSGDDNLFTRFDFRMKFIHDLSVSHSAGNVFSSGRGVDLTFDHHKRAPYENLYTDLDAGEGLEVWRCGGGRALGKNCGARGTFWNIRARRPIPYPPESFGPPSMNLVAVFTDQPGRVEEDGVWFETFPPGAIRPANLHEAQLARRLRQERGTESAGR